MQTVQQPVERNVQGMRLFRGDAGGGPGEALPASPEEMVEEGRKEKV